MALLFMILLTGTHSVVAQGTLVYVYIDTSHTGVEAGTENEPYNTLQEGRAFAQAQLDGAWIKVKQSDGTWKTQEYVPPVRSGASGGPKDETPIATSTPLSPESTGTLLSDAVIYGLLAVFALALMLVVYQYQRRFRRR